MDAIRAASRAGRQQLPATEWSLIVAAGDSQHADSREALERLCSIYWYPVYAFIRRHGRDEDAARDLTQDFFARLLESRPLRFATRARGRFRSFLLTSVRNFLTNEWDRDRAAKRGGGQVLLSLESHAAESPCGLERADGATPESVFEKRWAVAVLDRTLERLREEHGTPEGLQRFTRLSPFLTGSSTDVSYAQVAADLGMTENAVKAAIHRMRKRFGRLLREEVGRTVENQARVDEEIRYLFAVLES